MLKINRKLSVYISLVLCAAMVAAVVVFMFFLPAFIDYLINRPGYNGESLQLTGYQILIIRAAGYGEAVLMLAALGMLFALLLLVRREKVFTAPAVELIRCISWCLIFMGIILIALTFFFTLAPVVGTAILFVGLTIRVVKNVIEAAVYLKEENDLTV